VFAKGATQQNYSILLIFICQHFDMVYGLSNNVFLILNDEKPIKQNKLKFNIKIESYNQRYNTDPL